MRTALAAVIVLCAGLAVPGPAVAQPSASDQATIQQFHELVGRYMALHQRLEGPLPPLTPTVDSWSTFLAREYLASGICRARLNARQGDVFTPPIAALFRRVIADAFAGRDVEAILTELNEEHPWEHGTHAVVNDRYPAGATHEVPVVVLQRLPQLPDDLEYRILDHDLVLWDVHADLVVDFIPHALTAPETTEG
jgi:hypothetical protein